MFLYPYTIISGSGLGLSYSSLNRIGEVNDFKGAGQANIKLYVNIANGNLIAQDHICRLVDRNGPLEIGYIFNDQARDNKWRLAAGAKKIKSITIQAACTLIEPDGHETTYTYDPSTQRYYAPGLSGSSAYLTVEQNGYKVYHPDSQVTEIYDAKGYMQSFTDREGRDTTFSYDANHELEFITGPSGIAYQFVRSGNQVYLYCNDNKVQELLMTWTFENGLLTKTQISNLYTTNLYTINYSYAAGRLMRITQSDGTEFKFAYALEKINRLMAGSAATGFNYSGFPTIKVVDPNNIVQTFELDNQNNISRIDRQTGFDVTDKIVDSTYYSYTTNGQLDTTTLPNSGTIKRTYLQPFGLCKEEQGPNGQLTRYFYSQNTQTPRLVSEVKYLDSTTRAVTRNVYDENYDGKGNTFLRFVISPEGSVTEYLPFSQNPQRAMGNPHFARVYPLINQFKDIPFDQAIPLNTILNWTATQDLTRITLQEFSYDQRGQRVLTYIYAALDESGKGIKDDQMGMQVKAHDGFGGLKLYESLAVYDLNIPTFSKTSQKFDAMQRKTFYQDALSNNTTYEYIDNQSQIKTTYPNNKVDVEQFDNRGLITRIQETASFDNTRTTNIQRDQGGRISVTTRYDGQFNIEFYDRQNRLGYTVSPMGRVVYHTIDAKHRYNITTSYYHPVDPKKLWFTYPPIPGVLPQVSLLEKQLDATQNPVLDRTSYQFFDLSDRVQYEVDADQRVIEYCYDNLNRLIGKIRYDGRLSDELLAKLKQGEVITLVPDLNKDQWWQYFYDLDDNEVAIQDPAGYVTLKQFDTNNRLIQKTVFATKTDHKPNLDAIIPSHSPKDANTFYYYNARKDCILSVDAENYVTTYSYYPNGKTKTSYRYTTKLPDNWGKSPNIIPLLPNKTSEDQLAVYQYDLLERPLENQLPFNEIEKFAYNTMGSQTFSQQYDGLAPDNSAPDYKRQHRKLFDGFEQCVKESEQENVNVNFYLHEFDPGTGLKLRTTDPLGGITYFFYDYDRRPIIEINALGTIVEITLNSFDEPEQTRKYTNQISLENIPPKGGFVTAEFRVVLDNLKSDQDAIIKREFNKQAKETKVTDPEGYVTTYNYNGFKNPVEEILPLNKDQENFLAAYMKVTHAWESRGFEVKTTHQSSDGSIVSDDYYTYDNPFGQLTDHTDAIGNHTHYELDCLARRIKTIDPMKITRESKELDAFGRPLAITDGLNNKTSFAYSQAKRETKIKSPVEGQFEVITNNVFGEKIKREDSAGAKEAWEHESVGLITKHVQVIEDVDCETIDQYDVMHRQQSHQDANNNLTEFKLNLVGDLMDTTLDPNGQKLKTHIDRDTWGRAEKITDARGNVTENAFDKRDLLTREIIDPDHLKLTKINAYNGQSMQISNIEGDGTTPTQYQEFYVQDGINRNFKKVIDPITTDNFNGLNLTTTLQLDLANQTIATVNDKGNVTYFFYDECGRERFNVDPEGGVIEKQYDNNGNVIYQRTYVTQVDTTLLNNNTTLAEMVGYAKAIENKFDGGMWYFYDANNQERFSLSSVGAVNEKRYNLAVPPKIIEEVSYYTAIDPIQLIGKAADQVAAYMSDRTHAKDRHTYYARNNAGRIRFTFDPEGYVTEKRYDKKGNVITEILFNQKVNDPETLSKLSLKEITSRLNYADPKNEVTYTIYDLRDHPMYVVKPEGNVIFYGHDENGNLVSESKFNRWLTSIPENYSDLVTLLKEKWEPNKDNGDRIYEYGFDAANRKCKATDPNGKSDIFELDAVANIKSHTDRNQSIWNYIYDRDRREKQEISPPTSLTEINYDPTGRTGLLTATELKNQNVIRLKEYDDKANTITVTQGYVTNEARKVITYLNKCDNPIKVEVVEVPIDDPAKQADFQNRPETVQNITCETIYNGKQKPIVVKDEAGNLTFLVYDSEERLIYTVDTRGAVIENSLDTFGEVEKETKYATVLTIDLSQYATKGLTLEIVKTNLKTSPDDRVTFYYSDHRSDPILIKKGPVFYYTPNESNPDVPAYGFDYQQEQKQYTAARLCYLNSVLKDPATQTWDKTLFWFDRNHTQVAKVDGKNFVIRDKVNPFNEINDHSEFANPLSETPDPTITVQTLDVMIQPNLEKDRHTLTQHDIVGNPVEMTYKNADIQILQVVNDLPTLVNQVINLTVKQQFSPTGKLVQITHEDGQSEYIYYDSRDLEIARTGIAFTTLDDNNQTVKLIPLTYFGINAHGEQVKTLRFKLGAASAEVNQFPSPKGISSEDQEILEQFDPHGLVRFKQDAEKNLFANTYIGTKKLVRNWYALTNWKYDKTQSLFSPVYSIDENQIVYENNFPVCLTILRDHVKKQQTFTHRNAFNEPYEEGPNGINFPSILNYDRVGRVWSSNPKGADEIQCFDLRNNPTLTLKSATKKLGDVNYNDLSQLMTWNITDLERTESGFDKVGNQTLQMLPAYPQQGVLLAQPVPISMQVAKILPPENQNQDSTKTILNWLLPQERNVDMTFKIWSVTDTSHPVTKEITLIENDRCAVDISDLATGIYQYAIDYFLIGTSKTNLIYTTKGFIQFDTGLQETSTTICVMANNSTITLSGKTNNLQKVSLWQNNTQIAELPVNNSELDLSAYASGAYSIKPIYGDSTEGLMSLPFTIYTPIPSVTPLSREIEFQINLIVNGNQSQVVWSVDKAFEQQPIQITCDYVATDGQPYTLPATTLEKGQALNFEHEVQSITDISVNLRVKQGLDPKDDIWIPMMIAISPDQEKKQANSTIHFQAILPENNNASLPRLLYFKEEMHEVKDRSSVGMSRLDVTEAIKRANDIANTQGHSFTLWQQHKNNPTQLTILKTFGEPIGNTLHLLLDLQGRIQTLREIGFRQTMQPNKQANTKKSELADWEMIKDELNEDWLDLSSHTQSNLKEPTEFTAHFTKRTILSITPMSVFSENATVYFRDMSLDRLADQKELTPTDITPEGIVLDVTLLANGCYPYSVGDYKNLQFNIGRGSTVYPSDNYPTSHNQVLLPADFPKILHPIRHFKHDAWRNIIYYQDALGNVTTKKYNFRNQEIEMIQPTVLVTSEDNKKTIGNPITQQGFNQRGMLIGKSSLKDTTTKVTTGYLLDEAGHMEREVLADGLIAHYSVFDALGRETRYQNARGNWWQKNYDHRDNLIRFTYPSGRRFQTFSFNEIGKLSVSNDAEGRIRHLNYDEMHYKSAEFEPLGGMTSYINERHGYTIRVVYPNGLYQEHTYDFNGVLLSWNDLSRAKYSPIYDNKKQMIGLVSEGGSHGERMTLSHLSVKTDDGYEWRTFSFIHPVSPVQNQWRFVAGRIVEENNYTNNKQSLYGYDLEGRTVVHQWYQDQILQRTTRSQLDALSREVLLADSNLTMYIGLDLANNRVSMRTDMYFSRNHFITEERWNSYSVTNNILIDGGSFDYTNKKIVVGNGFQYSYHQGMRVGELNNNIESTLQYDSDLLLYDVNRSDGKWVKRSCNLANEVIQIENSESEKFILGYNGNGWSTGQSYYKGDKLQSEVTYTYTHPSFPGLPVRQTTVSYSYDEDDLTATIRDQLTHNYVNFMEPKTSKVNGIRTLYANGEVKDSEYQSVNLFHDSNGNTTIIAGQQDPDDPKLEYADLTALDVSDNGLIFSKDLYHGYGNKAGMTLQKTTRHFFTVNQEYLGMYDPNTGESKTGFIAQLVSAVGGVASGVPGFWRGQRQDAFQYADVTPSVTTLPKATAQEKHPGLQFSFPPPLPTNYPVMKGDTPETIAEKIYGSRSFAPQIEAANALMDSDSIYNGYPGLRLPQAVPSHNQAGMYTPYYQFTQKIMGNLYPYLKTPEIKQHANPAAILGKVLVESIAITIGMIVAPQITGPLLLSGAITTTLAASANFVIAGVTAGLVDAAAQGLAIGLKMQNKFSWGEVGSVAIASGVGAASGVLIGNQTAARAMLRAGIDSVTQQLYQLSVGATRQFDVGAVASSMLGAGLVRGTQLHAPNLEMPMSQLSSALINPLFHGGHYDVDIIVAQAIGGMAGNAIGSSLGTSLAQSLDKQIEQLQNYIKSSTGSVHARSPQPIKATSSTATNRQKLDQVSKSKLGIDPNKSRTMRFQEGAVSSNKWEQWQLNARDALIQDEMDSLFPRDLDLSNREQKQVENWQKPTSVEIKTKLNTASVALAYGEGLGKGIISGISAPFYFMETAMKDPLILVYSLAKFYMNESYVLNHPGKALDTIKNSWNNFLHSDVSVQAKTLGELTAFPLTGFEGSVAKLFSSKITLGFIGLAGSTKILRNDVKSFVPKGGSYREVRGVNIGGEVHHMPAASASDLPYSKGPAIWMTKEDHMLTASYGSGRVADIYRNNQKELMDSGRMRDAIAMDIRDIRSLFGTKYNEGLLQMLLYAREQGYIQKVVQERVEIVAYDR